MFNEELKDRFSKEYTDSVTLRKNCYYAFKALEKYEEMWGGDICTQPAEVIQPAIDELTGMRVQSIRNRLAIYQEYVKWCIKNNVPGACDGCLKVELSGMSKLKKRTIKNPRHLQRYLDDICEPEDELTTDNIIRCFCWLAYSGMPEDDTLLVKKTDVNLSKMVITFEGIEYPIYREALPCIKNCMELTQFVFKHPNYTGKTVLRDRPAGSELVRGIRKLPSLAGIRAELSRKAMQAASNGKTQLRLSYRRIWLSGIFYRMYEDELAGFEPNFYNIVVREKSGVQYKLDSGRNTVEAIYRKIAKQYLEDYRRWKMTLTL